MIVKNYAYWAIDTFIPYVDNFDVREAVALADREVGTDWVKKNQNALTKRASVGSVDDYGFQDRWYQLGSYMDDYRVSLAYEPYVSKIDFDKWAKLEVPLALNKRWLKESVENQKWAKRPFNELNKIWKEY